MPSFWSKVDRRVHVDAKVRSLSPVPPCGQGLWWYLLTAPETTPIPGLIAAGPLALAESLGWSPEAFREAFGEVFREGLAEADWKARLVWIPHAIRYNFPESPNVILGWARYADLLPECELRTTALRALRAHFEQDAARRTSEASDSKSTDRRDPEAYLKAFRKAFPEAFIEAFIEALPEVTRSHVTRVPAPVSVLFLDSVSVSVSEDHSSSRSASAGPTLRSPVAKKARGVDDSSPKKPPARYLTLDKGVSMLDRYPDLDSPPLREALREFLEVAEGEGKALSAPAITQQLKACKAMGPDRALAALVNSAQRRLSTVMEPFPERAPPNGKGSSKKRAWSDDLAAENAAMEAERRPEVRTM